MSTEPTDPASLGQRVDELIATYLAAEDAGEAPDWREWLGRYPELAPALESFFADRDRLGAMVRPPGPVDAGEETLRDAADSPDGDRPGSLATADLSHSTFRALWVRSRSFGTYELLEEIGAGGQGAVFKARQVSPHRVVALKMIRGGRQAPASEVRRFRDEADAVADLDHPNIVPVYDAGEHEGNLYFTMKLMEGGSLSQRLAQFAADPRAAARLMVPIARAVQHAHRRGILHRDLKPSNILFDLDGLPHVTDFGLAKRLGPGFEETQSGVVVGTPPYMAPEQASGRRGAVTTATDVYGLGAVLYTMLRGRPPFRGDSALDVLEQVKSRDPEPPSGSNGRVDRDLETICLTCLRKDPQRRYGSAEALADDLERWLAGEPIRARRTRAWERAVKWARRRPGVAALIASVVVVTALGVAGILWKWREAVAAQRALESAIYFNSIALAEQAWSEGRFGRAVRLLEEGCDERLRGWEWNYLMRLRRAGPRVLPAHQGIVNALAFDEGGRFLITAGADNTAKVWDLDDPAAPPVVLRGHDAPVRGVAFRPHDGRVVATVSRDGDLAAWDRTTGQRLYRVHVAKEVLCVAFSPDGATIVTGDSANHVTRWDAGTGAWFDTLREHTNVVLSVSYSADGRLLASASDDGTVILWDVAGRRSPLKLDRRTDTVRGLAFCPDSRRLATACADGIVRVWDVATGREALEIRGFHTDSVRGVSFSADGARIASCGGDGTVRLWDTRTGREAIVLRGHDGTVQGVAFSPDKRRLASCGSDGTVRIWDATPVGNGYEAVRTLRGHEGVVEGVAFSPSGGTIASAGGDHVVKLWHAGRGEVLCTIKEHTSQLYSVTFSPDGKTVASAGSDRTIRLSEASSGRPLFASPELDDDVWGLAYSPDGELLASCQGDGTIKIWRTQGGVLRLLRTFPRSPKKMWCVAFSPDGHSLVSGGGDRSVRLWNLMDERQPSRVLGHHEGDVYGVAFSPDGKTIASTGSDRTVKLWHATGGPAARRPYQASEGFDSVAFSPDGYHLAAANSDGTVKVLDAATLEPILTLYGHTSRVLSVAFSPDGKLLASGAFDRTVKVWDVTRWPRPRRGKTAEEEAAEERRE
jgi:WD40 repeat protein/tRNA A-37 threonylcarbamoyl transferase component Bud32